MGELLSEIGRNKICSLAQTALKVEPAVSKFEELSESMRAADVHPNIEPEVIITEQSASQNVPNRFVFQILQFVGHPGNLNIVIETL